MDQTKTEPVPVKLANGTTIKIEVTPQEGPGREDVAGLNDLSFKDFSETLKDIVSELKGALDKAKPDKATVKFGVEMAVESGALTTMIVKGAGKGILEITLEWDNKGK
ncbi:conserved hypothetical protein [Desulfosarcina cetonica]|uniref:CU044_2847 family protein n=1 Tax=Desulfosarcina cetonica TaxID=90730 RepID=UPI0006D1B951|nr:CU044_2847 family protein [Desulfosarcina cetonica]VTR70777.1 conserved hypothetical protein [Desulfosarcina cetonica]